VQSSPDTLVFWIFFFAKRNIRLLRAALVVFILDWKIIDVEFSSRAPLLHSIIKENIKKKTVSCLFVGQMEAWSFTCLTPMTHALSSCAWNILTS